MLIPERSKIPKDIRQKIGFRAQSHSHSLKLVKMHSRIFCITPKMTNNLQEEDSTVSTQQGMPTRANIDLELYSDVGKLFLTFPHSGRESWCTPQFAGRGDVITTAAYCLRNEWNGV